MDISIMSIFIIKTIKNKYGVKKCKKSLDLSQLIKICEIENTVDNLNKYDNLDKTISLSEINFSSPLYKEYDNEKEVKKKRKNQSLSEGSDFRKTYCFFIRIIYSILKVNAEIFNEDDDIITLKNNYKLIKSLEESKKEIVNDHIVNIKKHICESINSNYNDYVTIYISKIKVLEQVISYINLLISSNTFKKTDNMFSLIVPFFYKMNKYIEEYN